VVGAFGGGRSRLEAALRRDPPLIPPPETALTASTELLDRLIPPRTLRRVDAYARLAILAARLALEDAGLADGAPENTGLVVATGMGPTANTLELQPTDVALADLALSPILFSNSVQNAAAAHISMLLRMRGPSLSINQYELAVPLAFQTAIDWLAEGRTPMVLVGSVDGFSKALHEEALGRCRRGGAAAPEAVPVGEGSAFFLLARPDPSVRAHAVVEAVRTGGRGTPLTAEAPVLRNGQGATVPPGGEFPGALGFAHVYGVFPTSMGMDVAAAVLLLQSAPGARSGSHTAGPAGRICCLKQGETGDWGTIVVAREDSEVTSPNIS
jgi:3-oxoacyl-[acyl-carrier-protein] synthase II